MGALLSALGIAAAANTLDSVLLRSGRNFNGISADVVIAEEHTDELEITKHPVEQGAPISDHAYPKPPELTIRMAWSTSQHLVGDIVSLITSGSLGTSIQDTYQTVLDLQKSRVPFSIVTGKRSYDNMLARSIKVLTDADNENLLMMTVAFEGVIIVATQVTSASPLLGTVQNQTNPQNTAPAINTGSLNLGSNNAVAASTIFNSWPIGGQ